MEHVARSQLGSLQTCGREDSPSEIEWKDKETRVHAPYL